MNDEASERRGRGIGRMVVLEFLGRARARQKHVMIAGIDADNLIAISLHESLGFRGAGHFHDVGFKFGRWLDLMFLECRL